MRKSKVPEAVIIFNLHFCAFISSSKPKRKISSKKKPLFVVHYLVAYSLRTFGF